MKNLMKSAFALFVAAFAMTACNSDKIEFEKPVGPEQESSTGYLCFSEEGMSVITDSEVVRAEALNVDDFLCEIFREKNGVKSSVMSFAYGERPEAPIELKVGSYELVVKSQAEEAEDMAWESPVYGATVPFTIQAEETNTLETVRCKLQNIKVTVGYSADLAEILQAGSTTDVSLLEAKASFVDQDARAAYFASKAEQNTLVVEMSLNYGDKNAKMSTSISGVKAGQWRKLTVNMPHANEGNVTFTITVETLTADEEIVVDVAELTELAEEVIPDSGKLNPDGPMITWGDYTLPTVEEPFKLMASHFDENGNCTLPALTIDANNSTITEFVVKVESTSLSYTNFWAGMEEFDLCTVTGSDARILSAYGIPTGVNVLDKASVMFPVGGLLEEIFVNNYVGDHTFTMTITNKAGHTQVIPLIFSYTTGAAPSIVWVDHDINETYTVTIDLEAEIKVLAEGGVKDLVVSIDSDILTSGELAGVGLSSTFSLVTPPSETMAGSLNNLGFPTGGDVLGKTELTFSITSFMPILAGVGGSTGGYANFTLTVTDNGGVTVSETIKLIMTSNQ